MTIVVIRHPGEYPGLKQFPTRRIVGKRRLRTFRASEEYEQLMLDRQHGETLFMLFLIQNMHTNLIH